MFVRERNQQFAGNGGAVNVQRHGGGLLAYRPDFVAVVFITANHVSKAAAHRFAKELRSKRSVVRILPVDELMLPFAQFGLNILDGGVEQSGLVEAGHCARRLDEPL